MSQPGTHDAPELSGGDVASEAQKAFSVNRRHHLLAFYGTGREASVRVNETDVAVIPVDCELRLRERLLDLPSDARAVFLVPWNGTLPQDIAGRFALAGRIRRVGIDDRIRTLFGAGSSEEVRDCPLARYLLRYHGDARFVAPGGHLTRDAMWSSWLERCWSVPKGELALDSLLGFAAVDGHGPSFADTLEGRDGGRAVREALVAHFEARLGPCGPVVWRAWEAGRGRDVLHLAILASALHGNKDGGVIVGLGMLAERLGGVGADEPAVLGQLAGVSDAALRSVRQRVDAKETRTILREADEQVTRAQLRPHLLASNLLPSAWQGRLEELGKALSAVAQDATPAKVAAAIAAFGRLEAHDLFIEERHRLVIHRAQMAVRLAGWLTERDPIAPSASTLGDVEALSSWFATEGGYVDWARKAARGQYAGTFGEGVAAIVDRADGIRQEFDRRFARTLPAWLDAGRPARQVVPIEQSIKRLASAFLAGNDERTLLVLLMDGMAWMQAVEILDSLGQQAPVWGPLAWHGVTKNRIGSGPFPAMLANFPTVTEVSRSAFFAGKAMVAGKELSSTKDVDKWQTSREALTYCADNLTPRLLLKAAGHTKDGSASQEALSLVADMRRRMVGIVINTIDMSLKADAAQRHEWQVDTIKSLRDLLDKARDVGRAVMLVADHGHVPADRFGASAGPVTGGARWRPWRKGDTVAADYEVSLAAGEGVWAPRGADGVVLLTDDTRRYGGSACAGEHGGASLAEVVAPCLLIGCEDSPAIAEDPAQSVSPARVPTWWHFNVGSGLAMSGAAAATVRGRRKSVKPKTQLSLPQMAQPATNTDEVVITGSGFASSALLATQTKNKDGRRRVVKAVEFLLGRNGIAEAAAFEQAMGLFPNRARGLVAQLQGILNVDGYQVLTFDPTSKQVRLEVEMLAQLFEVEL